MGGKATVPGSRADDEPGRRVMASSAALAPGDGPCRPRVSYLVHGPPKRRQRALDGRDDIRR
jgi:hypothetical protein